MTNHHISTDTLLAQLNWRYATKVFDPAKKILDSDWAALGLFVGPCLDLGSRMFIALVCLDPFQDLAVAFAGREFDPQRHCVDAEKLEDALIEGAVVVKLAVLAGDLGPSFIEHAGKEHVAAEAGAGAAGWALSEVGEVIHFEHEGIKCER